MSEIDNVNVIEAEGDAGEEGEVEEEVGERGQKEEDIGEREVEEEEGERVVEEETGEVEEAVEEIEEQDTAEVSERSQELLVNIVEGVLETGEELVMLRREEEVLGEFGEEQEQVDLIEDFSPPIWAVGEGDELQYYLDDEREMEEEQLTVDGERRRLEEEYKKKISPFYMKWCFGVKKTSPVINLTRRDRQELFYVCSQFGVVYDYRHDEMVFLPGHQNTITSISSDKTGRWLTTADVGDDHVIIVWDNVNKRPVWTIYNPFPGLGVKCCQISPDAKYLTASVYSDKPMLKFWLWTRGRECPDGTLELPEDVEMIVDITYNVDKCEEFVVTARKCVVFVSWTGDVLSPSYPQVRSKGKIGTLTQSVYLGQDDVVLTGTTSGHVIIWSDDPVTGQKRYVKTSKLQRSSITCLQTADGVVTTSSANGTITFHDAQLKLLYWINKNNLESIERFSFHMESNLSLEQLQTDKNCSEDEAKQKHRLSGADTERFTLFELDKEDDKLPTDCSLENNPFYVRDLILLTKSGKLGYLSPTKNKFKYILYECEGRVQSIDVHPNKTYLLAGTDRGKLWLYDYETREALMSKSLCDCAITCIRYNKQGTDLAVGLFNGEILFLDPLVLEVRQKFEYVSSSISHICFTVGKMAHSSSDMIVCLYTKVDHTWTYTGKRQSHYRQITDVMFNVTGDTLLSIAEDRLLVQHDTHNVANYKLNVKTSTKIEQTAEPLCFTMATDNKIILSTNECKLKLLDENMSCCKTVSGPVTDAPINDIIKMSTLDNNNYIIYHTKKFIGLKMLPITGNPYEHISIVGHSEEIIHMCLTYDSRYLFTIGKNDRVIIMWDINPYCVDEVSELGGDGLEPYLTMLEGGAEGFLYKEMQDFFYYAMILHEGDDLIEERSHVNTIKTCEVPDLLRAIGYYPTHYEINNIINELLQENGDCVTFEQFFKVYINHRPYNGVSKRELTDALTLFSKETDENGELCIVKEDLYAALEDCGEVLTHEQLDNYLTILHHDDSENYTFPNVITISQFVTECLGVDDNITHEDVDKIINLAQQEADD